MEVSSVTKDEEILVDKSSIDDGTKEIESDNFENENDKNIVQENFQSTNTIDYDDEDSGDDFAVITKTSGASDSPAKTMFSIKTISNTQIQNNYKLSKTAVDLDHPGNINGVPTIDYDLSKLVDEFKPWKKPGADVSDYFNYGFTEETWLLYCEKQKTLRLSQENSALKTLSGLQNFGYPLSGSHIHLGFNRSNHKTNKGGLIDVISSQQSEYKNKHNDINLNMVNKISTIPVQTGNVNVGPNQPNNYMSGLANQALNNNILNPIMSAAMAMGILPNTANVQVLTNPPNAPIDAKMTQFNPIDSGSGGGAGGVRGGGGPGNHSYNSGMGGGGMGNPANNWPNQTTGSYERSNSVDSMHSHEDYDRKNYIKSERSSRHEESRRYRSRERRERSSERRRRSRSRSRERGYESKHSRKRNRTPEESGSSRRHRKHSRDRHSSGDSDRKHRRHRSSKRHRQSRSRSRSYDNRKERHQRRHKSPEEESGKYKSYKDENGDNNRSDNVKESSSSTTNNNGGPNIKREMDYSNNAD